MMKVELIRDVDDPETYKMSEMKISDWAVIESSSSECYSDLVGMLVDRLPLHTNGTHEFRVHAPDGTRYIEGDGFLVRDLAPNERIVITNRE